VGQAKNRKADIDALKAKGPKTKITKFMIRGDILPDGTVAFNTAALDQAQRDFVESCEQVMNTQQVPEMAKNGTVATADDAIAYVMYNTKEDFSASLMIGLKTTPDEAWQQLYDTFLGKPSYPQIGDRYNREQLDKISSGNGFMVDILTEGGIWPWPNAKCVLQRQGNEMVVIEHI
jgi:hypothetical protein